MLKREMKLFCCACLTGGMIAVAGAADVTVGTASSMEFAFPRGAAKKEVRPAAAARVRLARGERESFQLLVMCPSHDLGDVRVTSSDLVRDRPWWALWDRATLPSESIDCDVLGYCWTTFEKPKNQKHVMSTHVNVATNVTPGYALEWKYVTEPDWYPCPILDFLDGVEIRKGDVQSFWIRVRCPEDQPAGVYRGELSVSWTARGEAGLRTLPLEVRVNDFAVPRASPLPLAVTYDPLAYTTNSSGKAAGDAAEVAARNADPEGPVRLVKSRLGEWADFLADHYLTMDSLYHRTNQNWEVLTKLRDDGRLGIFNLGYWDYFKDEPDAERVWRETTLPYLKANYAKAKELGILDRAYVYGCDEVETNFFGNIRKCVEILRQELPGVPIMTTAYDRNFGVDSPLGDIDAFVPLTIYYKPDRAAVARAEGRQVWWYICCGPNGSWANGFTQHPPIDLRMLMGAQTVRMRPDGFLYYEVTMWNSRRPITRGPFTDWDVRSYADCNGDGCWTAVGPGGKPLSTIQLENFRDGLEDYAYALVLEKKLADHPYGPLANRAKQLLAVPRPLMDTMKNFSVDPHRLQAWRDEMADLIEREW